MDNIKNGEPHRGAGITGSANTFEMQHSGLRLQRAAVSRSQLIILVHRSIWFRSNSSHCCRGKNPASLLARRAQTSRTLPERRRKMAER